MEFATSDDPAMPDDTAYFLIRDAVDRRRCLIYGRLDNSVGDHCAIGAFWADNPGVTLNASLIDEVASVNDSPGPKASAKYRWMFVRKWLRWKLRVLATSKAAK